MIYMTFFAVILPLIPGFLLISYMFGATDELSVFEKVIYGSGIGMTYVTFIMFILGFLQVQFSLVTTTIMVITIIALMFMIVKSGLPVSRIFNYQGGQSLLPVKKMTRTEMLIVIPLTVWLLWKFFFVIYEGSILPVHGWDSWSNWSSGAKFFFYRKGLALNPADEHFFGWGIRSHLNYPLHPFLLQVWYSLCTGGIHEVVMKFWNVLYYISTVALIFLAVRRVSSLVIAVSSAFFLSTAPLFTYHALDAYADLSLSFYVLATAISFSRYISANSGTKNNGDKYLALMGIFAACVLWTKLEGLLFVASFSAVLLLFFFTKKIPLKKIFWYIVPVSMVSVIWNVFLIRNHISMLVRNKQNLSGGFHFEVLRTIWEQIMFFGNFNIIFFAFFVVLIFGAKVILGSDLKYLFFVLFGATFLFVSVYVTTVEYKEAISLQALDRNILAFLPMIYYIFALTVSKLLKISEHQ